MKKWSSVLTIVGIVLGHIMCAVVGYNYCNMIWLGKSGMTSAPAYVAFVYAVPFGIAIAISLITAVILNRKGK